VRPFASMLRGPLPAAVAAPSADHVAPAAGGSVLDARAGFAGHELGSGSAWLTGTTPPITD
jgi:hypothetical protein